MSSSSTVHGGQYDTKYMTFEYLMQAAFVGGRISVVCPEPASINSYILRAAEQGEAGLFEQSTYLAVVDCLYAPAWGQDSAVYKKVRISVSIRWAIRQKTVYRVYFHAS